MCHLVLYSPIYMHSSQGHISRQITIFDPSQFFPSSFTFALPRVQFPASLPYLERIFLFLLTPPFSSPWIPFPDFRENAFSFSRTTFSCATHLYSTYVCVCVCPFCVHSAFHRVATRHIFHPFPFSHYSCSTSRLCLSRVHFPLSSSSSNIPSLLFQIVAAFTHASTFSSRTV